MKPNSISGKLILNATIWAVILAFLGGLVLTEVFRASAEKTFDRQLSIVLKILVGELAEQMVEASPLTPPANLGEPRYELPLSGWYWTVIEQQTGKVVLSSMSLVGGDWKSSATVSTPDDAGYLAPSYGQGPDGKQLRIIARVIRFDENKAYTFSVTGNAQELEEQITKFQIAAWFIMGCLGLLSLSIIFLLVRHGLRPLEDLQERLKDVTEGRVDTIEGNYPAEVSGLVQEANSLIVSNRDTLERARTQVGNLAHALKTPLSVIVNETRDLDEEPGTKIADQTLVMRDQIQFYLDRARIAAQRNMLGVVTEIKPPIQRLTNAMDKIYGRDGCSVSLVAEGDLKFRGEEQDLEEMVGNLLDNACKWADRTVKVTLSSTLPESSNLQRHRSELDEQRANWLAIRIEDDGKGLSTEQMQEVKRRGHRLDESKPGSGLGLSIVDELVGLYQGEFLLSRSSMGGLQVDLILPAV